jgi:hypothetical protein
MIAIRKAARTPLTRPSAARASDVDNSGGAPPPPPTLRGVEDDSFWAPVTRCERCGGDYDLVSVRTSRGPALVEVCPRCDLGAGELAARRKAADSSAEPAFLD